MEPDFPLELAKAAIHFIIIISSKDVENLLRNITHGNVKLYSNSVHSSAVSLNTKHAMTIWPSDCTPGHFPGRKENLGSNKKLSMNVYGNFIHNSPKLETTQASFNGCIVKLWNIDIDYHLPIKRSKILIYATNQMTF